ncbi:long-chain fatty acid--CoA ligase [Amylibacter sp. SFDW26]|uniref:AMP-binding protein n=1 Tax=Amylibacter sp. SFDW26 TaxID=2652722 RepID=UPI0012614999|nr:AMP-binding protein [Amylibacter sp. SFDW26]KAB7616317.1 long-chain fatty acid--CoA ligase [Amylibacter sp. SFDW26]
MSSDHIISWHQDAVLTDSSGSSIAAHAAKPHANCDPLTPISSLPSYIAGISSGHLPLMGHFDGERPSVIGDFLTQTGGSTGQPKIIQRSSESWLCSFHYMHEHYAIDPNARVAALGYLNHSLALYAALEALHLGADFHALCGLSPAQCAKAMQERGITHLYATPTQLRLLASTPIPTVNYVFVGGGMMDVPNKTHVTQVFPNAEIIEFYGSAETSFITLSDKYTPTGSVGKPFLDVRIEIRNERKELCAPNLVGDVWVKTPLLFNQYLFTSSNVTQKNGDYICVGEKGSLDKSGYLFIKGRTDRAVNIADQIVYLDQIETTLQSIPNLENIALFAKPDALRGNIIHAVIQSESITLKDIASVLPRAIQPRSLVTVSKWPLLPSGKTNYKALEHLIKGTSDDN